MSTTTQQRSFRLSRRTLELLAGLVATTGQSRNSLYVHQLVATLRGNDGGIDQTAADLGISSQQVRAAVAYHDDFRDEVDDDAAVAARAEQEERERWERQQQAIA